MPSRIIANSLARNSTERAPCSTRGSLNTPASSRLYHNTKPSRSQSKILSRSPRRERNTNKWPLCGFSPMTALTRSAKRSNPQRMSVASLAIQIRAPCARSIACKLGNPITPPSPPPPATPAPVRHRILVPPSGSGHSAAGFQHAHRLLRSALPPPLALPGIASARCRATVSSMRENTPCPEHAHGRTPSHPVRYAPARKPAFAISPMSSLPVCFAWSCRNIAMRHRLSQDGVRLALTMYVLVAIVRKRLGLEASLYQTLQILSVTLFEKTPISQALQTFDLEANLLGDPNQLILFNL